MVHQAPALFPAHPTSMAFRVFLTGSGIAEGACTLLEEHGCVLQAGDPADSASQLCHKLSEFRPDALIVRQGQITAEVLDAAPTLRVITKHGVGTDNIDIAAATARKIPVLFTPGTNANAAAEHTLALILSLTRQIPVQDRAIRDGSFDKSNYGAVELKGRTVGLIGFGRIARRLMELLGPFGCRVLIYHPSKTEETLPAFASKVRDLEEVLRGADVLSLHCPLNDTTRHLLDHRALSLMPEGSLLVNTARGGLVDEAAITTALRVGPLAGAALDVFEAEPLPADSPLRREPRVVLTAHVAGMSDQSVVNMGMMAAENVLAVLEERPVDPAALLNPEVLGG